MLKENIHVCHRRGESHWLTPDPAWSRYSHGIGVCIRDDAFSTQPFADAVAGAAARLVDRVRVARGIGA